jgi:hypothetical protein
VAAAAERRLEGRWVLGLFGRFVYSEGEWRQEAVGDHYLAIDIHDSDIATVEYRPAPGEGRFYFGFQPRDYFEDPEASGTVEADAEVDGLVRWAQRVLDVEVTPTASPGNGGAGSPDATPLLAWQRCDRVLLRRSSLHRHYGRITDLPLAHGGREGEV